MSMAAMHFSESAAINKWKVTTKAINTEIMLRKMEQQRSSVHKIYKEEDFANCFCQARVMGRERKL